MQPETNNANKFDTQEESRVQSVSDVLMKNMVRRKATLNELVLIDNSFQSNTLNER